MGAFAEQLKSHNVTYIGSAPLLEIKARNEVDPNANLVAQRIAALELVKNMPELHGQVMVQAVYGDMTPMGGE